MKYKKYIDERIKQQAGLPSLSQSAVQGRSRKEKEYTMIQDAGTRANYVPILLKMLSNTRLFERLAWRCYSMTRLHDSCETDGKAKDIGQVEISQD